MKIKLKINIFLYIDALILNLYEILSILNIDNNFLLSISNSVYSEKKDVLRKKLSFSILNINLGLCTEIF